MDFYKIETPTTKQIFDAIINKEYVPIEKMQSKAKQVKILLLDYYCTDEILVTFTGVTNCGGVPIFLTSDCSLYEIANEEDEDFYNLSEEEQNNEIELLGYYLTTYDELFNL